MWFDRELVWGCKGFFFVGFFEDSQGFGTSFFDKGSDVCMELKRVYNLLYSLVTCFYKDLNIGFVQVLLIRTSKR